MQRLFSSQYFQPISKLYLRIQKDTLVSNSFYLMASTLVLSFFGFIFWVICARLYSSEQIGIATTLISITSLITSISMLGFNVGLIRYLPEIEDKNALISTTLTISGLFASLLSIIFLVGLEFFSPKLVFLRSNTFFTIILPFFFFTAAINAITDSVFIGLRSAKYIFWTNLIMSVVKIGVPFIFVFLSNYGIYTSFMLVILTAMTLSLLFMKSSFNLKYSININAGILKNIWKFSISNYVAGVLGMLSSTILPILITNILTPVDTAYYYMPSMIVSLLLTVPRSLSSSLLAEGSAEFEGGVKKKLIKTFILAYLILIPAVFIIFFFGKYVLLVFGKNYSDAGISFLRLSSLSTLPACINYMIGALLLIKKKSKDIILISIVNVISTLIFTYIFLSKGLLGIGISLILVQFVLIVVGIVALMKFYPFKKNEEYY